MDCRHCKNPLSHLFLDLGYAPPSNAYLQAADLSRPELTYPLRVRVCDHCWLVQTEDYTRADDLFRSDYAYFSSTSSSWLEHARQYTEAIVPRLGLDASSFVVELASNDGYLLRNFVSSGIPCLGIEPTHATAEAARELGIPVREEFFGEALGQKLCDAGQSADLIIGNNVYAHVPDINDFTAGLRAALKPEGTITLEFPHLLELIRHRQFDTVYHEHFSYLSLTAVQSIFDRAGLRIWDVERLPTHGGSLRIYGCHHQASRTTNPAVATLLQEEQDGGLTRLTTYQAFQKQADQIKDDLLAFLIEQKRAGKKIAAYGAAAKGNTLLNYAGVKPDLLPFVCDAAPSKQGKWLPGSHIPVRPPSALTEYRPDWILILPWNIAPEVIEQQQSARTWGAQFIVAVPSLKSLE